MIDIELVARQIGFELKGLAADVAFVGLGIRVNSAVSVALPDGAKSVRGGVVIEGQMMRDKMRYNPK